MAKKQDRVVSRSKGRDTTHKKEGKGRAYTEQLGAGINGIGPFLRRNWIIVKGCLIFAGCILAFMLIRSWLLDNEAMAPVFNFTATVTGFIANILGASTQVDGSLITSPDFSMSIVFGCTAIVPIAIYASAVIAYPCSIKQKAAGIALGIAVLYILNLVRTVSLFFIGSHFSRSFFDTAHFLIWQPIMILVAIVIWLFWVEKLVRVTTK